MTEHATDPRIDPEFDCPLDDELSDDALDRSPGALRISMITSGCQIDRSSRR